MPCCHVTGSLQVQDHHHDVQRLSAWLLKSKFWELEELRHTASLLPWHTICKDKVLEWRPSAFPVKACFWFCLHSSEPRPWTLLGTACSHCAWKLPSESHLWGSFHQPPFRQLLNHARFPTHLG